MNFFSLTVKAYSYLSDIFVTSKLWNTFHKRCDVIPNLKKTLTDLGLAYLDLYLIHWPMGYDNQEYIIIYTPQKDKNAKKKAKKKFQIRKYYYKKTCKKKM